ncbi:cupin domain-containing protein [Candidatus Poribacteria bacterium]|nr:cupin domain-containing protein [Candidatus Poribacteria bacterium]
MPFVNRADLASFSLSDGIRLQVTWGERMMVSFVSFAPDGMVPEHSHPHEQMGTVLDGEFELVIDGESRIVRSGDVWHVPANVTHSARALGAPALALDIFSPSREDYEARASLAAEAGDA